jgi:XTP/dITP diphosphohydrolase
MVKLLIATNNPGKWREYQEILTSLPLALTSPPNEGIKLDPEETGLTFAENAIIKAKAFARASGLLTLADDSGLEIDALDGEPGIYSARYGHTAKDDHIGRYQLVLDKLAAKNMQWTERTARFRCVVALATTERLVGTTQGTVEGFIAYEPKGDNGFGYDPIFFVPEFNHTLAEMTSAQKHSISHRARAAQAAIPLLEQFLKPVDKQGR